MKHPRRGNALSSVLAATSVITLAAVLAGLDFLTGSAPFVCGRRKGLAQEGLLPYCREVLISRHASAGQKARFECWVDFRAGRFKNPSASAFASVMLAECPKVRESILELVGAVKQSFSSSAIDLPDKNFLDGVILDEEFGEEAQEQLQNLGIPVYTANRSIEGQKLPGNAAFVCSVEDGMPFAISVPTQVIVSQRQRQGAENIYAFAVEDADAKAAREREEEEEMARYKEGLADDSKYVLPPKKRMNELFGLSTNRGAQLPVGQLLAKAIPPHPLVWAKILMVRGGGGNI